MMDGHEYDPYDDKSALKGGFWRLVRVLHVLREGCDWAVFMLRGCVRTLYTHTVVMCAEEVKRSKSAG